MRRNSSQRYSHRWSFRAATHARLAGKPLYYLYLVSTLTEIVSKTTALQTSNRDYIQYQRRILHTSETLLSKVCYCQFSPENIDPQCWWVAIRLLVSCGPNQRKNYNLTVPRASRYGTPLDVVYAFATCTAILFDL